MSIRGGRLVDSEVLKDLSVSNIVYYKHTRLVPRDMAPSFVQYKSLFLDNRHRFTIHILKTTFVVHCDSALLSV
jgi:hypothetical protein